MRTHTIRVVRAIHTIHTIRTIPKVRTRLVQHGASHPGLLRIPLLALLALSGGAASSMPRAAAQSPGTPIYLPLGMRAVALGALPRPIAFVPSPTPPPSPTDAATATLTPAPEPTRAPTDAPAPTRAAPTPVSCAARPLAQRVGVTSVTVGAAIKANDEYSPIALAPREDGGALVAWREQTPLVVHVGTFDDKDALVGKPLAFPGEEVHALVAHADGGAMVVVENDPDIYSPKYCRGSATPDKSYCAKLDLWRFDGRGKTLWRTTATSKTNVDKDGALFVWWYQHTARLVWTGTHYGLYFRTAVSSPRPGVAGEIDIHAADTFRLFDGAGQALASAWNWGCSHSWAVRLAFNGHFGTVCHGDGYPNAFHAVVMDPAKQLGDSALHENLDPAKRALGGLVPTPKGFWLLHMAQPAAAMELHLAFIDNTGKVAQDKTLPAAKGLETAYPFRAYLAEYGADALLAGWMSGGKLQLAVLDKDSGALREGPVAVSAMIDKWVEFVPYPSGDVGWAWSPGGSAKLDIVRVASCRR